jgi:hypothetical protein
MRPKTSKSNAFVPATTAKMQPFVGLRACKCLIKLSFSRPSVDAANKKGGPPGPPLTTFGGFRT